MNGELLRLVDALHREKDIEKEILFEAIEGAITSAIRKRHDPEGEIEAKIDRLSGEIEVYEEGELKSYPDMGRIQAQTAKQVIIQKIREAERDVIYSEYENKVGEIVNGNVQRIEGGNVIVNLGRAEGFLPRQEKIRGENYQPGDRIKALIYDVKKVGQKVKIMLTRASPDLVVRLFELEVPEIGEKIIEIKRIAREPGYRTKIAVSSYDMRVDCIGACVGIRGSRIKSITDELNDEKIDIIRWNESAEVLIVNSLKPAHISSMILDEDDKVATVMVPDDMLSLAIGRKGQNVRLATKLTGWDIRIQSMNQPPPGAAVSEDPEVVGFREALLQGTSFEKTATKEEKEPQGDEASTSGESETTQKVDEDQSPLPEEGEPTAVKAEGEASQEEIPADSEDALAVAEDAPAESENTPSDSDDAPAESEEEPSNSEEETSESDSTVAEAAEEMAPALEDEDDSEEGEEKEKAKDTGSNEGS